MIHAMKRIVWTAAIVTLVTGRVFGQDASSIVGTAKDQSGAALPVTTLNAECAEFAERELGRDVQCSASFAVSAFIVIWS